MVKTFPSFTPRTQPVAGGETQWRRSLTEHHLGARISVFLFLLTLPISAMAAPISLPAPIFFEDFNSTAEGGLPAGWSRTNYSTLPANNSNLQDLDSLPYAGWLVVDRNRFTSNFLSYTSHTPADYSRVLSFNSANVVNGQTITNLATGRFAFCTSGYREGNQVQYLFSPDFNLTTRTNVYLSYHSLFEQNQDSIGAVEYSIDHGATWLPVVYMLDGPDVLSGTNGIDALKTFTNRYSDVATFVYPGTNITNGSYYGAFIGVASNQWATLASYISARVNDDQVESKRVELFRLPAADNQGAVRFRFAHAGTDSWYFGIDDFGLYSITPGAIPVISAAPTDLRVSAGASAVLSVTATGQEPLSYQWLFNGVAIAGATNSTLFLSPVSGTNQGTYTVVVSNVSGSVQSGGATLSIYTPTVTSQWDFDQGDLRATVGSDLEAVSNTLAITTFPLLNINGQFSGALGFGSNSVRQGFYMRHGAKPNAGGHFVNQYTLLMDVMFPAFSTGQFRALFQSDPFNHDNNDAEFYVGNSAAAPDPNGIGAEGQFHGSLAADTWYRIAFAVDLLAPPGQQLSKYVNGIKVATQSLSGGVDGRYALGPTALLFTSGMTNGGFTSPGFVNSLQVIDGWLPASAIAALGAPIATGLPPGNGVLRISSISQNASSLTLNWNGPDIPFQLQQTTGLTQTFWQNVGPATTNRTSSLPITNSRAFYRLKQNRPDIQTGQLPNGEQSIPSKQILNAPGRQLQFSGRPVDLALSLDGRTAFIKDKSALLAVDVDSWSLLTTVNYPGGGASMHGIAVNTNGSHVYVSGAGNELYDFAVGTNRSVTFSRTISMPGSYPCGIALSPNGSNAYVCLSIANTLAVVNLSNGTITRQIATGRAPWDVVLSPNGGTAYVSDWGGRNPVGGDLTANSAGSSVVIDNRGVASSGAVSVVDLVSGVETAQVATGLHPSDLELSADGTTLYVANANSDTVTVINTTTRTVKETILVRPDPTFPYGSGSDGVTLSKDGAKLFVANAGNNAVAVIELPNAQHTNSLLQGFIPTDWFPGAVAVDTNFLYSVNVKGLGSRLGQPVNDTWGIYAFLATISKIPLPAQDTLSKYTAQVFEDGRVPHIKQTQLLSRPGQPPVPVPARVGEPSVFQHVLYILKENKTYDQVFGDIPQGNGNASLCVYPQSVSPNHHALAQQYVLLDNFYCNGVLSADGHSWATEANSTDHLEKSFGGFSRSYTFGDDPLTYSSTGFIWNNVLQHGLTFRNYGEFDYASPVPSSATWMQIYTDFTNGTRSIHYAQNIGVASLRPYSSTNVPGWNLGIPDVVRADGFIRELHQAESNGVWASFHFLYLPNDHTGGPPSPQAQVADNDLALGQVVEAVTKSIFGSNTVIFMTEDDPQSGYDHVDGHRSLCLVISPYTKRGQVISTFYNQAGVIHTVERILGLPAMNQQDAMAPLMFDCFTNVPNFTAYTTLTNNVPLAQGAVASAPLSRKQRYWARQLQKMDLSKPDRINDDVFNRYVWFTVKGDAPYPSQFAGAHGKGLKQLGLKLDKNVKDDDD